MTSRRSFLKILAGAIPAAYATPWLKAAPSDTPIAEVDINTHTIKLLRSEVDPAVLYRFLVDKFDEPDLICEEHPIEAVPVEYEYRLTNGWRLRT